MTGSSASSTRSIAKRILKFLHERVAKLDDPRSIGKALRGSRLGEFWKYRVGDYRLIARSKTTAWSCWFSALDIAKKSTASALRGNLFSITCSLQEEDSIPRIASRAKRRLQFVRFCTEFIDSVNSIEFCRFANPVNPLFSRYIRLRFRPAPPSPPARRPHMYLTTLWPVCHIQCSFRFLTPGARRSYLWRETNPAGAKSASTAN